jgi:hypothetical protein
VCVSVKFICELVRIKVVGGDLFSVANIVRIVLSVYQLSSSIHALPVTEIVPIRERLLNKISLDIKKTRVKNKLAVFFLGIILINKDSGHQIFMSV